MLNLIKLILKSERFIKEQLWQSLLVIAFILFCAYIFNKPFESVMFCISHIVIRKRFDKQYHCNTTIKCLTLTCSIILFSLFITLSIRISLLSTIPICYFIAWVGYILQDRIDFKLENQNLNNQINELTTINLKALSEDELYKLCKENGLTDIQCDIVKYLIIDELKNSEIYRLIGYSKSQYFNIKKKITNIIIFKDI